METDTNNQVSKSSEIVERLSKCGQSKESIETRKERNKLVV